MSTTNFDRIHIEPLLDKASLVGWQAKMQDILEELDLWDYVNGCIMEPIVPDQHDGEKDSDYKTRVALEITAYKTWAKQDGKARRYQPGSRVCIIISGFC